MRLLWILKTTIDEGEQMTKPDILPSRFSKREPTHPGAILREDVLPALRVSVTEAARALGVTRQALHAVLAERAAVTPEIFLERLRYGVYT
jgi:addiction module HigA family antidote